MVRSTYAEAIRSFIDASRDRNASRAVRHGKAAIAAQPAAITDLLVDLRDAVDTGADEVALLLLDELDRRFTAVGSDETALFRRVAGGVERYDRRSSVRQELAAYRQDAGRLETLRGRVLLQAGLVLDPERSGDHPDDRRRLLDAIDALLELERTLTARRERVTAALDAVSIPPTIAVVEIAFAEDAITAGTTETTTARVRNVGDVATDTVTITPSATGSLSVQQGTTDVSSIAPRETASIEFTFEATDPGSGLLSVQAALSQTETHSESLQLLVTDAPAATPLFGEQPTDPDGDGLYEDLNSNDEVDITDVAQLLELFVSGEGNQYLEANSRFFDFDEDGDIDIADIQALLNELRGG